MRGRVIGAKGKSTDARGGAGVAVNIRGIGKAYDA